FFSDPIVEIKSYVIGGEIDGVITDFPATAVSYKKSQCLQAKELPPYMTPALPGDDVSEPPLPPVSKQAASDANSTSSGAPTPSKSNTHVTKMAGSFLSSLSMFVASLVLL
ncbi:hypothetical protein MKW94_002818, partial [Papaver nudicaule]|nr:hypothetical protein [Papaver nudicaule]